MNELLEKGQKFRIIPQNFKFSNIGKVVEVSNKNFVIELEHEPEGFLPNKMMEFYSQTKNGMLYFLTAATEIEGNKISAILPRKHRFLQRRAFSRIRFSSEIQLKCCDKEISVSTVDISAGGMKLKTDEKLDIDTIYSLGVQIGTRQLKCEYEPIRIEKSDAGRYTLSGRFLNLNNTDKMALIQFCMRKKFEMANR